MSRIGATIENMTFRLAEALAPQPFPYEKPNALYGSAVISTTHELAFLGRFERVSDFTNDFEEQEDTIGELHPWYKFQIPEMLAPLTVIEYPDFRLLVTPRVELAIGGPESYAMRKRMASYGLAADVCDGEVGNLGYVYDHQGERHAVIYDPGALSINDRDWPETFNADTVTERQETYARFSPYKQQLRINDNAQAGMWRRRGYDLRGIYEKALNFAVQTGGELVLSPNRAISNWRLG